MRVDKRLDGWKRECLSRDGRLTLIQSVLDNLPIFFQSLFNILAGVVESIEQKTCNFLWGGEEDANSMHLVKS